MVSGAVSDSSDRRAAKALSHLKTFQTQHKLKPGSATSWQTFQGEFKSGLDAGALPALNRAKPYSIMECYEMLPLKNRNEIAAAALHAELNELYEEAQDLEAFLRGSVHEQ